MVYQAMYGHQHEYTLWEKAGILGVSSSAIINGHRRECPKRERKPIRNWQG
jgi:hypothetical protein